MRRTKLAPVLTVLLQDLTRQANEPRKKSYPMPGDAQIARLATTEVRALLAVARAAEGVRRYVVESGYEGMEGPADKALFRALDRLTRSGRGR